MASTRRRCGIDAVMFQRRHYRAIVNVLHKMPKDATKWDVVEAMMTLFEEDNPNFRKSWFARACIMRDGLTEEEKAAWFK